MPEKQLTDEEQSELNVANPDHEALGRLSKKEVISQIERIIRGLVATLDDGPDDGRAMAIAYLAKMAEADPSPAAAQFLKDLVDSIQFRYGVAIQ
jgi:hypothetical protein